MSQEKHCVKNALEKATISQEIKAFEDKIELTRMDAFLPQHLKDVIIDSYQKTIDFLIDNNKERILPLGENIRYEDDERLPISEKGKLFIQKQGDRGLRHNNGKLLYNLLPEYPIEQIVKVLTKGAEKYEKDNWKKGMPWTEVEASLKRHLAAWKVGEDFDKETGLYHMAHVATNAIFLIDYYRSNPQFDDRPKSYLKMPKIVLDIDEVLCGWASGYEAYTGNNVAKLGGYWDSSYTTGEELKKLETDKDFWVNLPCIRRPNFVPHAYVSSRGIPVEWTMEWLEKNNLPCRPVHHVAWGASKVEVLKSLDTEIFIDDRFENFASAQMAGITSFLMDATHNQHWDVGYKRLNNLELKNIIRG